MPIGGRLSRAMALARYHRPSQFSWRLVRMAQRALQSRLPRQWFFTPGRRSARFKPKARGAMQEIAAHRRGLWPSRVSHAKAISRGEFCFLNQTRNLSLTTGHRKPQIDWNPPATRLWRFHLQCMESLLELAYAVDPAAAYDVIGSWLDEPRHQYPTVDPDAWHPFCISRRLPVWLMLAAEFDPPAELEASFWNSVADQTAWLSSHCERDLGGNHLLENLATLYLADSFLDFRPQIDLRFVEPWLRGQLEEQILETGEHFERTPTYHALMMVCVLQCVEAAKLRQSPFRKEFQTHAARMSRFAKWIRQPHGRFPLLADSVEDETPDLDRLLAWAERSAPRQTDNDPAVDYWSAQLDTESRLLLDVGPVACDHLPAHGHCDLFQIVATLDGHDAIVDTGNFDYEPTPRRMYCRGTSAHNVLQLAAKELCDVWSSFRMGRRATVKFCDRGRDGDTSWCLAMHDGYGVPCGRVVLSDGLSWTIVDWYTGLSDRLSATCHFHWHPQWSLTRASADAVQAGRRDAVGRQWSVQRLNARSDVEIRPSDYFPTFGLREANQRIRLSLKPATAGWLGVRIAPDSVLDRQQATPSLNSDEIVVPLGGDRWIAWNARSGRRCAPG